MATLAELEGAFATLGTIFRTDISPRVNALKRQVDGGAGYQEVASEINSIRAEFDNAYARVAEILQQAEQLDPLPSDLITSLDRSINTNQSNNRAVLANIEIQARANQERLDQQVADRAQADQGPGTTSAGSIQTESETAGDDGSMSQNPPVDSQVIDQDGAISDQSAQTVPTNAETTPTTTGGDAAGGQASDPEVPFGPPTLSNNQANNASGGGADTGSAGGPNTTDLGTITVTAQRQDSQLENRALSESTQFYVYKAIKVTHSFSGGRFTQDLEGAILQIPVDRRSRQNGLLVPQAANTASQADTVRSGTNNGTAADANQNRIPAVDTNITGANVSVVPTVRPTTNSDDSVSGATEPDTTNYSAAENSAPDSDGQPVEVSRPAGTTGEGSATTNVGGFTIKASSGAASNGVFVTVFVVSRNGVQGFADDIDGIVAAAQSVQQRSLGGVVEDVQAWVASGGAAQLQGQAEAQAQAPTVGTATTNLARET